MKLQVFKENTNIRTSKTTLELLDDINWSCPDKITIELYEIEVALGDPSNIMRGRLNKQIINELYLPEFNIGINQARGYNIIPNAYTRYNKSDLESEQKPKLIKCVEMESCEELFDLICVSIRAKNLGPKISQLFEMVNNK